MGAIDPWFAFVLAALATWRITHLIAEEDGPADLILKLRSTLGTNALGTLMDCFQCLSLWIAIPCAFAVTRSLPEWVLVWLALSGAACLLERFRAAPADLPAYPLSFPENHDDVVLRPREGDPEDRRSL
ncbi:MAG: DUF1360 domain-containing protein [Nitrococcus sp.]|nr:DUF1360 domain-containing protein [Nitrococcus sp.]